MAQLVECSVWDREVPGSSPGAPILSKQRYPFMQNLTPKQRALLPCANILHTTKQFKTLKINKDISLISSNAIKTPFIFDRLVLSVSAKLDKTAALLLQASVKTAAGWSSFYKLSYISQDYKKSFAEQKDKFAHTNIDELLIKKGATAFKYKITILGKAKIDLISVSLCKKGAKYDKTLAQETLDLKHFELDLKPLSQKEYEDKKLRNIICSATSLAMVLDYYGKLTSLKNVCSGVKDQQTGIFGNWPLNVAYASQCGLKGAVLHCASLAQAEGEILQARPLIVSIAFKNSALKNSPQKQTDGHLVVIAGFDEKGNPIVYDPAAPKAKSVRRIYDRKQFAVAWLKNKKGLAYALGK